MQQLFGTDGVRGVANRWLTPELSLALGRALGAFLREQSQRPVVLVGRDTRASGPMIESAVVAGLNSTGVSCRTVGVLPTPAVAYLTQSGGYEAGVMISASHNPIQDNGIKIFSRDGTKLSDDEERLIAAWTGQIMQGDDELPRPIAGEVGGQGVLADALDTYVDRLVSALPVDLAGLKIVLDCGHGAAYEAAPRVFQQLGAEVICINADPDGTNINVACGSNHPQVVAEEVRRHGADGGFAFDGDADRVIAVDAEGNVIDGDHMLAALALDCQRRGQLKEPMIAVTPYSNGGLRRILREHGIGVIEAPTGDKNVLEAMRQHGLILGGEQSGHVILLSHSTGGDGLLVSLALLAATIEVGHSLTDVSRLIDRLPQIVVDVPVADKELWDQNPEIIRSVEEAESLLTDDGRIFVRASGTEPVIRVLGEGDDDEAVHLAVDKVVRVIDHELGTDKSL